MDGEPTALFPFGHGLSYSTFAFSNLSVVPPPLDATKDNGAVITLTITNNGMVASGVTAQAYCDGTRASATLHVMRYKRMLCGFTKVFLTPGESQRVAITVSGLLV
jgi:hypothetical protein